MSEGKDNRPAGGEEAGPRQAASPGRRPERAILGDFELRREIGRGGMGTVYEATQRSLQRTVAVKVLKRQVSSSPKAVLRFQREAQAAAKLHHVHIIPIFALGEQDGVYYYAMELVSGPGLNAIIAEARARQAADTAISDLAETVSLSQMPQRRDSDAEGVKPVSSPQRSGGRVDRSDQPAGSHAFFEVDTSEEHFHRVAQHIAMIADALDYAHRQGVVHRDIKPHNLILGADGKLRVSDFGLARLSEQPGVTITGELIGSPLYMSPEQIKGGSTKVDQRTDIYSLGATMYEWLSLKPPYPGETREQIISSLLTSEPLALRAHNPQIPVDLETICLKAIERDRTRRYQTAGELRDDLRRFLQRRPIKARRAGLPSRTVKFLGRHRFASLAASAAVVALALGVALVSKEHQVQTQTALTEQAQEETEMMLDLFEKLPLEKLVALKIAEVAAPMLEGVVGAGQQTVIDVGGDPAATGTPSGIARRTVHDFYEAIVGGVWPGRKPDGSDELSMLLRRSVECWQREPDTAVQLISDYLSQRPDHFEALQYRAALLGGQGQFKAMLKDTEEMVRLRMDDSNAYALRGLAYLLLGEAERSLDDLNCAKEMTEASAWITAMGGLALAEAQRDAEAILAFEDALAVDPELVAALLGRAYARAALGDLIGSVTDLSSAIELEPDNADMLVLRGDRYVELNEYEAAERDYARAMELMGRTVRPWQVVVRYFFARSQQRNAVKPGAIPSGEPQEAKVKTKQETTSDATSNGLLQNWLLRLSSPQP